MSNNLDQSIAPQKDDFFVTPAIDNNDFLEIFTSLNSEIPASKWREILKKSDATNEIQVLIETALELSTAKRQGLLFRKHQNSDDTLISIWLSRVFKKAKYSYLTDKPKVFSRITSSDLRNIAKLSLDIESPKKIAKYLLETFGIILILDHGFTGMKLDGVATKLSSGQPIIALSLRYTRYDYFWFTLLHELSHVALHYAELESVIYDDLDIMGSTEIEREANRMAVDSIVPRHLFNKSSALRDNDDLHIYELAERSEVHPALVAGIIKHHKNNYRLYSSMTNTIDVREMLGIKP
jgi:HTH-type transcriptional regulator/antitoxin HigA